MNCTRRLALLVPGLLVGSPLTNIAAPRVYRVGVLGLGTVTGYARDLAAIRERLDGLGYVDGQNLIIESRFADHLAERLPALAAELVRLKVDVILTITTPAALAAKASTSTIPIVMAGSANPVELGLVNSLSRPGGNVTGVTNSPGDGFAAKQLQLLKEAAPKISRVVALMADSQLETSVLGSMQTAGASLGLAVVAFKVDSPSEIDLDALGKLRAEGLYVFPNAINGKHSKAILAFAANNRLPSIYGEREMVEAGGLMSYWTDWIGLRRHAVEFVDRILKGAKAAELPVERPATFELVINLRTAKVLGLAIPQALLVRADVVIE
jgi:putative ABC transport system substrate-binding protein